MFRICFISPVSNSQFHVPKAPTIANSVAPMTGIWPFSVPFSHLLPPPPKNSHVMWKWGSWCLHSIFSQSWTYHLGGKNFLELLGVWLCQSLFRSRDLLALVEALIRTQITLCLTVKSFIAKAKQSHLVCLNNTQNTAGYIVHTSLLNECRIS